MARFHEKNLGWTALCALTIVLAAVSLPGAVHGEEQSQKDKAPIAGEPYQTELFGERVDVPPRDRRSVTAANFGVQHIINGPSQLETLPFGSLFVWRNWDDDRRRFRGVISGFFNDLNYNIGSRWLKGWELMFTLDNIIIPVGRSEYVEGQRISEVEVEWNQIYGGVGLAYRSRMAPWRQDSAVEVSLTYEPGFLWFKGKKEASPNFIVPTDTYEGRVRLRVRADGLLRNLMEMPHQGISFGGDLVYGHRSRWNEWGGVAFPPPDVSRERTYTAASAFAVVAGGVPFLESERHRLVSSLYGGIGKDLDRFSAFRLPGRPTGFEWDALALPLLPAAAFNEFFPTKYAVANLMYHYQALFFLYPYIRATYSLVERPRFGDGGTIRNKMDSLPAIGGGVITGAPWHSQVEVNYTYNFGMIRDPGGQREYGSHGIFVLWSKEFPSGRSTEEAQRGK